MIHPWFQSLNLPGQPCYTTSKKKNDSRRTSAGHSAMHDAHRPATSVPHHEHDCARAQPYSIQARARTRRYFHPIPIFIQPCSYPIANSVTANQSPSPTNPYHTNLSRRRLIRVSKPAPLLTTILIGMDTNVETADVESALDCCWPFGQFMHTIHHSSWH